MDDHEQHDETIHTHDTLHRSSDGETYLGAKGVDEAVPSPTHLATETGFGTQTLPYQPLLDTYGHHGTGMASQSSQFTSLPPVTGPAGSGNPGREGTGMGTLHWQMADANDLASSQIVAVVLEDTAAMHKALINVIEPDHVVLFDHHSEPAIAGLSAMSGAIEYHEDGTINLDRTVTEEEHPAHAPIPANQEDTPDHPLHEEGVSHPEFVDHADHVNEPH